ncbi:MAG: hypothetical protein PHC61_01905 [Chitinivibrionales bacterium]|nr:hypothetical protein [Chitinivibrionales bacterium]
MKKHFVIQNVFPAVFLLSAATSLLAFTAHVQTPGGSALSGVAVTFSGVDTTVYSDMSGNVNLTMSTSIGAHLGEKAFSPAWLRFANRRISLYLPASEKVDIGLYTLSGRQLFAQSGLLEKGPHTMPLPPVAPGIYVLKAVVGNKSLVRKINQFTVCQWNGGVQEIAATPRLTKKVAAGAGDTAVFTKSGYNTARRLLGSYADNLCTVVMDSTANMTFVKAVSAGNNQTMIVKQNGTLWAAGYNDYGQLGTGDTIDRARNKTLPTQVMNGVSAVSTGFGHTMVLKQDGTLWATGWNKFGQLGDGTTVNKLTPVQVMSSVAAVSAGYDHTMILKQDGTLWATGNNFFGQLGTGDTTSVKSPVEVMSAVSAVSAGYGHTLILKQTGVLWAAGENNNGQLGVGTFAGKSNPVQVMSGVLAVSAGDQYSMVLKQDGSLWAMGENFYGQLGDGTTITSKSIPTQVMSGVAAVCAGVSHTMIIKQDGTLWATGDNLYSQLGDGTFIRKTIPVQVMSDVAAVCAGYGYSMILKKDGTLWATGANSACQLGDTIMTSYPIPPRQVLPPLLNGLTVSSGIGSGSFLAGSLVHITAYDLTASARTFDHWGGPDSALVLNLRSSALFNMPGRSAMVKAVYTVLP